jgi:hypothetical protein
MRLTSGLNLEAANRLVEAETAYRKALELAPERSGNYSKANAFQIAEVHGSRRETDAAFEWLRRAHTQRQRLVTTIASPRLLPLHADPRWAVFLKKSRLVE